MKKKILSGTIVVAALIIAGYGGLIAYQAQKENVSAMSDFLLLNVEALALENGGEIDKPNEQYVMVINKSGICCEIRPSGYPDRPNEKIKTRNSWHTGKREVLTDKNKDSNCTRQDCPSGEVPYTEP